MMTHKDLEVWKLGIDLVEKIYQVTREFPKEEIYGLTSQIRRAGISIPSNIAEGAARKNTKEYIQFLYIALGSLSELETQLVISQRLNYIDSDSIFEDVEKLRRKLLNLIKYMNSK
ncbi:MAG: four helix bundle protein [Acidobacteria bacterium]|nr:four helix bundle protein [Acidobacteriota bacterium]